MLVTPTWTFCSGDAELTGSSGRRRITRAGSFRLAAADPSGNLVAVNSPGSIRCGYVLMSLLPGVPLDTVRDQLPAADRDRLARRDHRGAALPAATTGQGLAACELAAFVAGPRIVSVNSTL